MLVNSVVGYTLNALPLIGWMDGAMSVYGYIVLMYAMMCVYSIGHKIEYKEHT